MRDIDIEDLLTWAYQAEKVDRRGGLARPRGHASAWASVSAFGRLGTRPDVSRVPEGFGDDVPADALAVEAAVMALERDTAALVVIHARAGTRPGYFDDGPPRLRPIVDAGGKAKMLRDARHKPIATMLEWSSDREHWQWECDQYAAWRTAVDALFDALGGRLEAHRVLPPRAARRPWEGEEDGRERRLAS